MNRSNQICLRRVGVVGVLCGCLVFATAGRAETTLQWALNFFGVSANSSSMKGPNDSASPGNIWTVMLAGSKPVALTADGGYQWPVVHPDGTSVIAMRTDVIVSVPVGGGPARVLFPAGSVRKLVGFDRKNPGRMLVLMASAEGRLAPGELSLTTGKASEAPNGHQQLDLIAHLEGQQRVYGELAVFPRALTDTGVTGAQIQWTDVHFTDGAGAARNISNCKPANCDQPSLSSDAHRVVFIRSTGRR